MDNEVEKKISIKEDEIDLSELWKVLVKKKKIAGGIVAGCTIVAFVIANFIPKEYTASAVLQSIDVKNTANYVECIKNSQVVGTTIQQVYEGEQVKPDVAAFTKKNLDIVNAKGTQMIQINAKGRTPEEAKQIADRIVENFMAFVADVNAGDNRSKIEKLEHLVEEARAESENAGRELEAYRASNNIRNPISQKIMSLGNTSFVNTIVVNNTGVTDKSEDVSWFISEDDGEYQEYLRNFMIKQSIYNNYANQAEVLKAENKDIMVDIKIISDAVLPSQPSGPKVKLITLIGFTVGCLLSVLYSLVIYKKECG